MTKLTDKQLAFCNEYLIDLNATQAAIRAGYSPSTANEQGSQNLVKLSIQNKISELKQLRAEKVEVTQEEVLKELKSFAYSDITETMDLSFEQIKELPPELRRMIASFKKTEVEGDGWNKVTYEIKFIDKMKAIEMINRHIGFYEADNTGTINLNINRNVIGGDKS